MSGSSTTPKARRGRRHILWNTAGVAVALAAVVAVLALWSNSAQFQNLVRERLAEQVENMTGGRVEIGAFHWRLLKLELEAENIVIHGDEPAGEAPYARIARLDARFSILGLARGIRLRDLEIDEPRMHLIFYRDGQTNQPHPAHPEGGGRSGLDTLFSMQAGHVAVNNGWIDLDNRAAFLDFQNRYQPLDFRGDDVSVTMRYLAAAAQQPERYRIDAGVRDLTLARGGTLQTKVPGVHGVLRATVDLMRDAIAINDLTLTAHTRGAPDRTLQIQGAWTNFANPRWRATVRGDLDMRLLDPVLGYPFAPEGIAHLDLACAGEHAQFGIDGTVHAEHAAYIAPGVVARDVDLTARVHADPLHLRITSVVARLQPGGTLTGEVLLDHWVPPSANQVQIRADVPHTTPKPTLRQRLMRHLHRAPAQRPPAPSLPHSALLTHAIVDVPVDGKVTAQFNGVSLDTILDIVGQRPFQRLGVATLVNGPTTAQWNKGDVNTLVVDAHLALAAQAAPPAGEAPGTGAVDATYKQRDGSVDVRSLELHLPGSTLNAHGRLGAFPLTSASALNLDFATQNLGEFDQVLRDLGLQRNGRAGTAALPISLSGRGEFHGMWAGSLLSPHLAGNMKATQVAMELPPHAEGAKPAWIHFDSVEATGSYDAEEIAIGHAHAQMGAAHLDVDGTLTAASAPSASTPGRARKNEGAELPGFGSDSLLHIHARAAQLKSGDLLSIIGQDLPVSGAVNAQIAIDGPLSAATGSGWAELDNGVVYGEPVDRIRAQGTASQQAVQLSSFTVQNASGTIAGAGSYNVASKQFTLNARGAGIDLSKIAKLQSAHAGVGGKLSVTVSADGSATEPHLQTRGTIAGLTLQGQSFGEVAFDAHSAGEMLAYNATTHFNSAGVGLNGQTKMGGDWQTDARVSFSHFDIGRLFSLAHLDNLHAQSALEGTASITGPLARVDEMKGELRLQPAALSIAGVHLASDGPIRATLANSEVHLDPVHITGDGTDLRAEGSAGLRGTQPLNFAANGSINLQLIETLDSDLTAAGSSHFQVKARGSVGSPSLTGTIDFENGSIALEDLPNGLSQLNGRLRFNQNRLEVEKLTAMTGGGKLDVGGYLAYQHGIFADLTVTGNAIRIRYPDGVSSQADAKLRVQGTPASLLLSGNVLITRFSVSPDFDMAALAAKATGVQPIALPNAPSNHVRLDVRIQSSPQLSFQNAYAKLAGDVDLRLRGTLATPSLLGRVSVTQGEAVIAGTRYELQRGDVTFTNPVRIQPMVDLTATARVEDYDITLGLHGTPDRMSTTLRSDPPLPETDVMALLALGRTQSEQGLYTQQQQQSIGLSPSTDVLLGGALNATVSSRVQKLFGAGSVKVDPSYLGALGNSTTRITVEEQVGKYVTLTYATNVDTSAQQLLQAEIAINRHVALLVTRDESNVFSMVIKATRRYR
ncbi:MAG: translocation/assembly module TamB domain-containing protein [Acidobacteriota bacterium]